MPVPSVPILEARQKITDFDQNVRPKQAVFDSKDVRFKQEQSRSPGPQEYEPTNEVEYSMRGPSNAVFGTQAQRDQLIQRDVSRSPFKQPTFVANPSPSVYETQSKMSKTSFVGGLGYASGADSKSGLDPTVALKQ